MTDRRAGRALALVVAAGTGGCASLFGSTESTVAVNTNPAAARCDLTGRGGFHAVVTTPGRVSVPNSAAPVSVTCTAAGYRPTSYTLDASADGWIWANSALVAVTGGAAVLGLLVDESRDAGKAYGQSVDYSLDPVGPRTVHAVDRHGGELLLQTQ